MHSPGQQRGQDGANHHQPETKLHRHQQAGVNGRRDDAPFHLRILQALDGKNCQATESKITVHAVEMASDNLSSVLYVNPPENPKIDRATDPYQYSENQNDEKIHE